MGTRASTPSSARSPRSTRLLLALGLAGAGVLVSSRAAGETLVFRDRARGQAQGKVLVEFEDMLFVALDGEPAQFVSRAELEAIVDSAGQRHERPALGAFGRVGGPSPVAAVTDVEGEATLTRADATAKPLTSGGPQFLRGGEVLTTGEAALVRWVFPSGAVVKQAPQTQLTASSSPVREELTLDRGEVFLEARHRPFELLLDPPVSARLAGGGQATLRRKEGSSHIQQHVGRTSVSWSAVSFTLDAGLGAEVAKLGTGRWRVTADPANPGPVDLQVDGKTFPLGPGETRVVGSGKAAPGEMWRLLRSDGELLLRRGPKATFTLVEKAQRDRLVVGAGDAIRTGPVGRATLVRADGASVELAGATRLDVEPVLALARGGVTIDALEKPVRVAAPAGDAALRLCVVSITRSPDGVTSATAGAEPAQVTRPEALELTGLAGKPLFPLAPYAQVELDPKARLRLTSGGPQTSVAVRSGAAVVRSRAAQNALDPGFRVRLRADESIALPRVKPGAPPVLALPGKRRLTFEGGPVGIRLALSPAVKGTFRSGASIQLKKGLQLALALAGTDPELRFRSGPRLRLQAPYAVEVENPTIRVAGKSGRSATCKLTGELTVNLLEGGTYSAAAFGIRAGDRLELPGGVIGSLERRPKMFRFALGPRRLWIENGAPPVQARQGDPNGTMFLTMPETPSLALSPRRPITVLATEGGEFIVLDDARFDLTSVDAGGLEALSGPGSSSTPDIARDRIPELLDVPRPDSPSGP